MLRGVFPSQRLGWLWLLGLLGTALALMIKVQAKLQFRQLDGAVLLGAAVSLGIWWWLIKRQPPKPDSLPTLDQRPLQHLTLRLGISAVAMFSALVAWHNLFGNEFNPLSTWAWLLAVGLWLLAWLPWQRPPLPRADRAETKRAWLTFGCLLIVTAVGLWIRLYRLDQMPYDMTVDHGWKMEDVYTILQGGRPLFLPNNTGREPGQFYYIATLIRFFGVPFGFIALKLGNVIIGTLTIPFIYLFARELGGRKLGILSAMLYALGKWPLETTRMGLRFPYATLPAALVLWSLWRYVRLGKRSDALLVGLWMGMGLYGYIGVRAVPFVIAAVFGLMAFDRRRRNRKSWLTLLGHGSLTLITTALIFLPLGHFMLDYPDVFWFRVSTRTSNHLDEISREFCQDTSSERACDIKKFVANNVNLAVAFNWRGDRNEVNNVRFDPLLDKVSAALLLLSLPIIVWRLLIERSWRWWMLVVSLPLLGLATTLSLAYPIENPSAARTGVLMPVIFTMAAAPLALAMEWLTKAKPFDQWWRGKRALQGLISVGMGIWLLAWAGRENFHRYFVDMARQYTGFIPNNREVADAIRYYRDAQGVPYANAYLMLNSYFWKESRNISVHLNDMQWYASNTIKPEMELVVPEKRPVIIVLNPDDQVHIEQLQREHPEGELRRISSAVGKDFLVFHLR
ncbi:glycosyltransferase family 39 protein [Herpetosiphon llansteffanensis]|uniref:glycosyltransferase family 39 protein n=1 Tax=Herpetosiphon llansteffanensis TaxID=2094568 RepID=UPI000D7CAB9B|nr:glycosyltransferase family 39 protein [Herpetosiphon llansteffanensis]